MKTAEHAALCKRLIEAYWRALGVQVFVTVEDGCLRSDLVNGMPAIDAGVRQTLPVQARGDV